MKNLVVIWKEKFHQEEKNVEILLNKYLKKFTAEHILVNRDKLSKKPKFDSYFKYIK